MQTLLQLTPVPMVPVAARAYPAGPCPDTSGARASAEWAACLDGFGPSPLSAADDGPVPHGGPSRRKGPAGPAGLGSRRSSAGLPTSSRSSARGPHPQSRSHRSRRCYFCGAAWCMPWGSNTARPSAPSARPLCHLGTSCAPWDFLCPMAGVQTSALSWRTTAGWSHHGFEIAFACFVPPCACVSCLGVVCSMAPSLFDHLLLIVARFAR